MTNRRTVAVVGCGWAGYRHAQAYIAEGAELRWAVDTDEKRAKAVAGLAPEVRTTPDFSAVLNDNEVEIVDICLPHHLHAHYAIEAASSGKHILCEKPLAVSLPDADRMIDAAADAGVLLMVAENEIFSPLYGKVKDLVASGAVGKLALVQMTRGAFLEESFKRDRPWFLNAEEAGGGMMMSGGIHDFEKLRMIVGEIESVFARRAPQRFLDMEGDDTSVALLQFREGATGIMIQSFLMKTARTASGVEEHSLRIEGERGSIRAVGTNGGTIRLFRDALADPSLTSSFVDAELVIPEVDTFRLEIAHLLECIATGNEPRTSGRRMRRALELVLAAYQSMSENKEVSVR